MMARCLSTMHGVDQRGSIMAPHSFMHSAVRRLAWALARIGHIPPNVPRRNIDDEMLRLLDHVGAGPPFDVYTICDRIIVGAKEVLGYEIEMAPHPTRDGGVSGFVYKRGRKYVVLYVPSDNPLVELWSKLHELFHVLCNHPIPDGYQLKAFLVRNEDDAEAESLTAAVMRWALSGEIAAARADVSPLAKLFHDDGHEP